MQIAEKCKVAASHLEGDVAFLLEEEGRRLDPPTTRLIAEKLTAAEHLRRMADRIERGAFNL